MPDRGELANETADALLAQIQSTAEHYTRPENVQALAYAYALVVGAAPGKLPGHPPPPK